MSSAVGRNGVRPSFYVSLRKARDFGGKAQEIGVADGIADGHAQASGAAERPTADGSRARRSRRPSTRTAARSPPRSHPTMIGTIGDSPPARHAVRRASARLSSDDLRCTSRRRSGSRSTRSSPALERRAQHRQRRRRENERARTIHHHVAQRARSGHPGAARAERLPSRVNRGDNAIAQSKLFDAPGSARAVHPGRMRFVDDHDGAGAIGDVADLAKRRQVAVHAEHALGDDDRAALARLSKRRLERIQILMRIDDRRRLRQPDAVDQARVVALV